MDDEEREVAQAVVDYLVAGDDQIASAVGTVRLHGVRPGRGLLPPPVTLRAQVAGEEYELTMVARRVRR